MVAPSSPGSYAASTGVRIPVAAGRSVPAELALPPARPTVSRGPAVIVIHEPTGLNDDIRSITRRFAANGYVALAPDLTGGGPLPLCIARFALGVSRAPSGRPYRDLAAVQRWLAARDDVDGERIGLAGFCMGGGFVILYAIHGTEPVRAIAPFYPALPRDDADLARLCPTVASFGARDRAFGGNGERLERVLAAAGVPHDVRTYPDAGHSFLNVHDGVTAWLDRLPPEHAGYEPNAAEDAWARVLHFFAVHLAGGQSADD